MAVIQGTSVDTTFLSFKKQFPDLYYAAGEGSKTLASINAGNSAADCLCVGLGGVNGAFLHVLSATQRRANLSKNQDCVAGNFDDYQDRHLKLLAKADAGAATWETYATTDPCQFSFVNPKRINQASGFIEGVCFVDVFDAKLTPDANALNVAMLYHAPPFGGNYATKAAFLAAIQAAAANIIQTISDYNALAAKKGLPVIEALRSTLYSSGYYNQTPKVPEDEIALAIFKGFSDALANDANSGLSELQFPVGDASRHQASLFEAVQKALAAGSAHARAQVGAGPRAMMMPGGVFGRPVENNPNENDDDGGVPDEPRPTVDVEAQGSPVASAAAGKVALKPAADALKTATEALDAGLISHTGVKPTGNYQVVPPQPANYSNAGLQHASYDAANSPFGSSGTYDAASSPLTDAGNYESASAPFGNSDPMDSPLNEIDLAKSPDTSTAAIKHCRGTVTAAREVSKALDLAFRNPAARDKALKSAVDAAARAKSEAEAAAKDNLENHKSLEQTDLVKGAKDLAKQASDVVNRAKADYAAADNAVARRKTIKRVLGGILVTFTTMVIQGILGGASYGIYVGVKGGADAAETPPTAQDLQTEGLALSVGGLDDLTPVTAKVLALNQAKNSGFPAEMVKAAHLTDANGNVNDNEGGGWSVSGTTITYTPTSPHHSGDTVSTYYTLEYSDPTIPQTEAAQLTITFVDKAVDRFAAAATTVGGKITADFDSIVSGQFVFNPKDATAWTKSGTTETFTLQPNITTPTVSEPYQLGSNLTMNRANLVVLLPPAAVASANASITTPTSIPLPDPGVMGVTWTLLDTRTTPPSPATAVDGWSLTNAGVGGATNKISYTPGTPAPLAGSTSQVQFALLATPVGAAKPTLSAAGTASITFASSSSHFPAATDIVVVAPNRTDAVQIPFPPGVVGLMVAATGSLGGGSWTPSGSQATFTPGTGTVGAPEATTTYTAQNLSGTGNITVVFPLDIMLDDLSRQGFVLIDVGSANPDLFKEKTLQSLAVKDTVPSKDPSNGTWTDLGSSTPSPMPGVLRFLPPPAPDTKITSSTVIQSDQIVKEYVVTFTDGTTSTAAVTLNFEMNLKAFDINATTSPTGTIPPFDIKANCYVPAGATLTSIVTSNAMGDGEWAIDDTAFTVTLTFKDVSPILSVDYTVTDSAGQTSTATITVSIAMGLMPKTANYLLTKDVWSAQRTVPMVCMDVLKNCKAFFGIDRDSLILTNPVDFGEDYDIPDAVVATGGKALRLPSQGSWLVTNDGRIGFVAEPGLTRPPTPVGFRYCDKKGLLSDEGVVIIHPDLDTIMAFPSGLTAVSDDDFWKPVWANVICSKSYEKHDVAASFTLLAGMIRMKERVGRDPVSARDFEQAYQAWFSAGKHWQEPSGKENPAALFAICRDLVDAATKGTKLPMRARYWRLTLMSRMLFYSPPLDLIRS